MVQQVSSVSSTQTSGSSKSDSQSSSATMTQVVAPVGSVNYQSIQSCVNSNLQSSNMLNRLSTGILSATDLTNTVVQSLNAYGVQSGISQRIAAQYLSFLGAGTSMQSYANAISSVVTQAVQQSKVVTAGQESNMCQAISSSISNSLNSLTSPGVPNYLTIQSSVSTNIQSASSLNRLSTGILSSNDLINTVTQVLTSNGVQNGIAQTVASQYLSNLGAGTSLQSYANAISSAVTQALQKSNTVTTGQEGNMGQRISSSVINSLNSLISQKAPFAPAPAPVVQQQISASSASQATASTAVSSQMSTTTSTEASVVAVDYQAIQSYVSFVLRASSSFNRLSTGILSANDVIRTVVKALTSYGVSSEIAQSTATQYLSSLNVRSPSQDYATAISTAVTQALQQTKLVRAGQEASTSQIISSNITNTFSSLISQKSRPAPAPILPEIPRPASRPLPALTPIVQQQVKSVSSTETSTSSEISSKTSKATSTQVVTPAVPVNYQTLQSCVNSNLQSSSRLNRLSSGILSANDVINTVVQSLSLYGVQSRIVQSVATQYLSSLGAGSSLQSYATAISSVVTQAILQSGALSPGQESSMCQAVSSTISTSLISLVSQKTPNYQTIQSCVNSNLQSSSALSRLSSGILSANDVIKTVVQGLTLYGIQNGIAQSAATQYIASLGTGSTLQSYASAVSSAVTQAVQQSNTITAGQETNFCQTVSSSISSSLSSMISQKTANFQTIQNSINSNLQSSTTLNRLSSGIVSTNDVISTVVQTLTSNGIPTAIAQSSASQYLSSLPDRTPLQSYANAISSAISQAVKQSNVITSGQESSWSQTITSTISNSLNSLLTQKTPNYQAIQSCVNSNLQSSNSLRSVSSGILSTNDVINTVVQGLTSSGFQSGVAQSAASKYLSTISKGAALQSYASAISSAVTQAVQQSNVITAGQESTFCQTVTSTISNSLTSLTSQKTPNYQIIQSSVSSNLQSSTVLNSLSSGIVSTNDVISKVIQGLTSNGVQTPVAQSVATQYLSSLPAGSTLQNYASAISSAVTQAVKQSNVITAGRELTWAQTVSSSISNALSSLISQKTPNYQTIQSCVNSNLQSSNMLRPLSTGVLSPNEVVNGVVQGLTSNSVQSGIAQNVAAQYLLSLTTGTSLESYSNAISFVVKDALQKSNTVISGQEVTACQTISSAITNSLSSMISRKPAPVPQPIQISMPALTPVVQQQISSSTSQAASTQVSSKTSTTTSTETVVPVVSVDYPAIQNYISFVLQSSSTLNRLTTGILSPNDVIRTVVKALSSFGVNTGASQSIATQYLSTLGVGSSAQDYANAISSVVAQVLQQSKLVRAGQEASTSQIISSYITNTFSSLISQKSRPAPAPLLPSVPRAEPSPLPAPMPIVQQQVSVSSTQAATSSASSSSQSSTATSTQVVAPVVPVNYQVIQDTVNSNIQSSSTLIRLSTGVLPTNDIINAVVQGLTPYGVPGGTAQNTATQYLSSLPVGTTLQTYANAISSAVTEAVKQSNVITAGQEPSFGRAVSTTISNSLSSLISQRVPSYQSIQSCVKTNLQSSSMLSRLSTGILSSNDVIGTVVQALTSNGLQGGMAQNIATQYLSTLSAGTSLESYSNAISFAVGKAFEQSNTISTGQEGNICQTISSSITSSLSSLISQKSQTVPALAPVSAPALAPVVTQVVKQESSQASSSSAVSSSQSSTSISTQQVSPQIPAPYVMSQPTAPSAMASVYSAQKSRLMTESAAQRISTLTSALNSVLTTGNVNYLSLSNALANAVSQINTSNSNLTQTEIFIEALLEIVVALLQYISPNAMDANLAATQFAESLARVM